MEKFEITDYDLDNEFNPNRKRRKFIKNDAIYGVFNDEDVWFSLQQGTAVSSHIDKIVVRNSFLNTPCLSRMIRTGNMTEVVGRSGWQTSR
jgi:hypothetical protein